MTMKEWLTQRLSERFAPIALTVTDESHQHHGHAGWREGGETHFRITIVASAFTGMSRLARHRAVNEAVTEAFARGLHALAIAAKTPEETSEG